MKVKFIIGGIIIIGAILFGALSFIESNVEYVGFEKAKSISKKVQVKGEWMKDKPSSFDANTGIFSFTMKDDDGIEQPVQYKGAKPNNFELAEMIVVKGKYGNDAFQASEILTKCPSKYEANSATNKAGN
jgi:cytochrome c-type biogenesis protein CcmE